MALNHVRIFYKSLCHFRPVSSCIWRSFCSEAEQKKVKRSESPTVTIEAVVASLRADRVTAKGLGLSRKALDNVFAAGRVYLNKVQVKKRHKNVKVGDQLDALRPEMEPNDEDNLVLGRVVLKEVGGETSNGRLHVVLQRCKFLEIPEKEFRQTYKNN